MNYCSFHLNHFNLFCPATGELICGPEEMNEKAKSLRGFWVSEVLDEPVISDANLKQAWHDAVKEAEGADSLILEKFLREYVAPNWCAFEVTTSGIACGPVSTTAWFVLDLDIQEADQEPRV
jgi:hypothetical protein